MLRSRYARWLYALCWLSAGSMLTGCAETSPSGTPAPESSWVAPATDQPGPLAEHSQQMPMRYRNAAVSNPTESAPGAPHSAPMTDLGTGPGMSGDKFAHLSESGFHSVRDQPLSTFSIDVDTASYSKARMYVMQRGVLPPIDAVRVEEFVNYFDYDYQPPTNGDPFAVHLEVAECPWTVGRQLVRVALKGREVQQERPPCNLVFLIDVSGSMASAERIGLVKQSLRMLAGQLTSRDRVAIVVYASQEGLVLPATEGDRQSEIVDALERLEAGGSTNGGAGIRLAYSVAKEQLIQGGVNRVILCTDGDFNVGVTSTGDLVRLAETEAKGGVFLTVLGFGMGNHNDAMLEELSNKANGAYAFIDSAAEARKVLIDQIDATLVTIAKDVKIQIEFNPGQVAGYRLIGYENRLLQAEDFNDDRKDAGEVGAGHTVTAFYELVMAGSQGEAAAPRVDPLRYQQPPQASLPAGSEELLTLKVRYKDPEGDRSRLLTVPLQRGERQFAEASTDFRFAASVAAFGMVLRQSKQADVNLDAVLEMATAAKGLDRRGYRGEFLQMVQAARQLNDRASSVIGTPRHVVIGAPRVAPNPRQVVATHPGRGSVQSPLVGGLALGIAIWLTLNALAAVMLLCLIGVVYSWLAGKRRGVPSGSTGGTGATFQDLKKS